MKRTSFSQWPCSIARTMDMLGDGWSAVVLREAFYGVRRFEDFHANLGVPRNTLTDRLNGLVEAGLLAKRPYQERPTRHEYVLTHKGIDFFPVLAAIASWGDRWLAGDDGPPIIFHHKTCEHDMQAKVACGECGEALHLKDIGARVGDGYPPRPAAQHR
jgi:DNA-binding HxlR family transcriptional regulator